MQMWFTTSRDISHILFKDWSVSSVGGLVGSCIIIIVIAVFFESLKSYKGLSNKKPEKKTSESMPLLGHLHINESRFNLMDHLRRTFLYLVQFLVGYFLMLVAMTYNVWLFLAVVIGCGIGYFLATPFMECYFDGKRKAASQTLDSYGRVSSFGDPGSL